MNFEFVINLNLSSFYAVRDEEDDVEVVVLSDDLQHPTTIDISTGHT